MDRLFKRTRISWILNSYNKTCQEHINTLIMHDPMAHLTGLVNLSTCQLVNFLLAPRIKKLYRAFIKIAKELVSAKHHIYLSVYKVTLKNVQ
jgi:hypothetical protein